MSTGNESLEESRPRRPRRPAAYDEESESSGPDLADKELSGQVKEEFVESVDEESKSEYPQGMAHGLIQERSNGMINGMSLEGTLGLSQESILELSADEKALFNKLDNAKQGVVAVMGHLQESIAEEKRIKDLANSANHE